MPFVSSWPRLKVGCRATCTRPAFAPAPKRVNRPQNVGSPVETHWLIAKFGSSCVIVSSILYFQKSREIEKFCSQLGSYTTPNVVTSPVSGFRFTLLVSRPVIWLFRLRETAP